MKQELLKYLMEHFSKFEKTTIEGAQLVSENDLAYYDS